MSRAVFSRLQCHCCRYNILQSFVAIAGVSLPAPRPKRQIGFIAPQIRPLSQTHRGWQDQQSSDKEYDNLRDYEEIEEGDEVSSTHTQAELSTSVPWYLQTPTSASAFSSPIQDQQKLPPLPDDPPSILSPVLHHLFESAGLDDLAIIDLRKLDPPPALGANLIMVLGTARSIKHLNVSADRFCRWLRSEYKLRPYADGLLGRNELKIRLRRRAKRAKLAASAGRQLDDTNRDDGITTGWVCVNVGAISGTNDLGANSEIEIEEEGGGFVGFGAKDMGPRLVVQMFTEEKRAELDLEGLWDYRQQRRAKKEELYAQELENELAEDLASAFDDVPCRNRF
ncbi:putative atpase synthesis protein [Phaeomoniella chlamydospora]|uniref:ATPase synthesis protein 25 n=1 Tax=Phaeomoniella chlamydospora TaxID=158046 RepID=A0A0G2GRE7_PHACM|nr:putative atpase synthesis protein [Phaeomoniella chlamydospora]